MAKATIKTKESIARELDTLVERFNKLSVSGKLTLKKANELEDAIKESQNQYTKFAKAECFAEILGTENPMLEAVKRLRFSTVKVVDEPLNPDKSSEEYNITVKKVITTAKNIDPAEIHAKKAIGADSTWAAKIEEFNKRMTARACTELGVDPKEVDDSYFMHKVARELKAGKVLTSNTAVLASLQEVVDAMLGKGYKALTHDVRYIDGLYLRKGKDSLHLVASSHKNFRMYITEVCHRIVTNGKYDVEYKRITQ